MAYMGIGRVPEEGTRSNDRGWKGHPAEMTPNNDVDTTTRWLNNLSRGEKRKWVGQACRGRRGIHGGFMRAWRGADAISWSRSGELWRKPASARRPVEAGRDDPQRALHMSVLAEAMRAKGFSDKSVAKVQQSAGEIMDRLYAQGVVVPAPRVSDPAGRVQQPRLRGNPGTPSIAPEVERMLQPATPAVPSR